MKNAFGEELDRSMVPRKTPWPIKLVMKMGAQNESQASVILAGIAVILIFIAISIFRSQPSFDPIDPSDLSDAQIQELIDRGINTDDFTPEQKRELDRRGIVY